MNYIKRKSKKQESRTAKEFGGKLTPASGALSGAKGDVRTGTRNGSLFNAEDYLIENKYTDKSYYPLALSIWKKIEQEALRDNMRVPMMQIDIADLSIVVMTLNDLSETLEEYEIKYTPHIETSSKSIRLNKFMLEELFDNSTFLGLQYHCGQAVTKLVLLKKQTLLDL